MTPLLRYLVPDLEMDPMVEDGETTFSIKKARLAPLCQKNRVLNRLCLALDQIISQMMENSNASRPVPVSEEVMQKLPREVLEAGCTHPFLEDYAVIAQASFYSSFIGEGLCCV